MMATATKDERTVAKTEGLPLARAINLCRLAREADIALPVLVDIIEENDLQGRWYGIGKALARMCGADVKLGHTPHSPSEPCSKKYTLAAERLTNLTHELGWVPYWYPIGD